jgi:predicted transposase YdaD
MAILATTASAGLDEERRDMYFDLILSSMSSEVARRALYEMDAVKYEYRSEFARRYFRRGKAEGKAEGNAAGKTEGKAEGARPPPRAPQTAVPARRHTALAAPQPARQSSITVLQIAK